MCLCIGLQQIIHSSILSVVAAGNMVANYEWILGWYSMFLWRKTLKQVFVPGHEFVYGFLLHKYMDEYMTGDIRIFWIRFNIWNINCARATVFIFDTRTGVLVKVSFLETEKYLDLRGTRTRKHRIHVECSNHLSYQGKAFVVPCFKHWLRKWIYRL